MKHAWEKNLNDLYIPIVFKHEMVISYDVTMNSPPPFCSKLGNYEKSGNFESHKIPSG